jgi:hypothetical protein
MLLSFQRPSHFSERGYLSLRCATRTMRPERGPESIANKGSDHNLVVGAVLLAAPSRQPGI